MLRWFFISLLWLSLAVPTYARQSVPVDTGKVTASLISDYDTAAPGQDIYIALRTVLDDHWHTYWRNPGDSGEPVQISWETPDGMIPGDIIWPLPRPIATGPIINYGFEGAPIFPVKFSVPASAEPGDVITVSANFYYLVCKDVCIPEQGTANLPIEIGAPKIDAKWKTEIQAAIAASPVNNGLSGTIKKTGENLLIQLQNLPAGNQSKAYFFPYTQGILGHSEAQIVRLGTDGLEITTKPDYLWNDPTPKTFSGVVAYDVDGIYTGQEVTLAVNQSINVGVKTAAAGKSVGGVTFITAIFGAFIGGLILNLMPCVFPIISLKALSLTHSAHAERSQAKRQAWLYTAGVLATFILLVGTLLALKAAGSSLGWGFQLQSPKVTGVLALLMFVIGLNLLGVFEIGGSLQNTGQSLTQSQDSKGSFFTGALAVIVATPCTAPFMAGAMGYALAQPALITFAVFMALGLGFAAPFLLLGYAPKLLSKLPKPGAWMETFKQFLAFPMFATAIWLAWVMGNQAGSTGLALLMIAALLIGFAIWVWPRGRLGKAVAALSLIGAVTLPLSLTTAAATQQIAKANTLAWSPQMVDDMLAEGRPVFVDFTADWCVTCKVNERLVLSTSKVEKLFEETNTAFLVADWTNKNDAIAAELESYDRAGVPLYLVFKPDNASGQDSVRAEVLPQILTFDVLEEALRGTN